MELLQTLVCLKHLVNFYNPKVFDRLIFVTMIQRLSMRVKIVVMALVNRIETFVVLHKLEVEMNRDLHVVIDFYTKESKLQI